jgi:hypothetical protein
MHLISELSSTSKKVTNLDCDSFACALLDTVSFARDECTDALSAHVCRTLLGVSMYVRSMHDTKAPLSNSLDEIKAFVWVWHVVDALLWLDGLC